MAGTKKPTRRKITRTTVMVNKSVAKMLKIIGLRTDLNMGETVEMLCRYWMEDHK
jgi:hypothetical protein